MSKAIHNAAEFTCRGCSLLCDDLSIIRGGQTEILSPQACQRGLNWLQRSSANVVDVAADEQYASPIASFQQKFANVTAPLVCGLQGLTLETERAACLWAENKRAYVSLGISAAAITAPQRYGSASCSFGEVRHRCDLIIAGNIDIFSEWPRFEERFITAAGRFRSDNRPRIVYLGTPENLQNVSAYDTVFRLTPDMLTEALLILRREIQENPPHNGTYLTGLDADQIERLRELSVQLKSTSYPVLFANSSDNYSLQWTRLTMETLEVARMHKISVKQGSSGGSPSETLLACSGFPDTVHYTSVGAEYDPVQFQAEQLVTQQRIDGCLYLADRVTEKWLPILTNCHQNGWPVAVVCEETDFWEQLPENVLKIRTARAGQQLTGTMLRADGIPIPLGAFCDSRSTTPGDLLRTF